MIASCRESTNKIGFVKVGVRTLHAERLLRNITIRYSVLEVAARVVVADATSLN